MAATLAPTRTVWRTPLTGRSAELELLQADLQRAAAGELRCALICGDPGVGKTRLGQELLARSRPAATPLSARAFALGATTPLSVWADALEPPLRDLSPDQLRALCGGYVDDLAGVLRSVAAIAPRAPAPSAPPFEGLAVLLRNLAARRPLALLLDDIHLADPSSWQALNYVASSVPGARVLIIATARPAELAELPAQSELLLRLEQEARLRRVDLLPLAEQATRELAEAALGGAPAPEALVRFLHGRSQGNPLFALGLLQALIDDRADLAAPGLREVPETLAGRVRTLLDRLDEPELATAELLAVLGRRVGLQDLAALAARPQERLAALLERLVVARLAVEAHTEGALTYELAHPLVADAIYERIGGVRRRALHRLAARSLNAAGRLSEAAPHFARSAEPGDDEAIDALVEAVREADAHEAHREEIAILAALADLLPAGDGRWLDVLGAMSAHADWVIEHRADIGAVTGLRAMREIERILEQRGDAQGLAVAKLRVGTFLTWGLGDLDAGEAKVREARALMEQAGDGPGVRRCDNELAWHDALRSDFRASAAESRALLERAEAAGDRGAALQAHGQLANALGAMGELEQSLPHFAESARIAREDGKRYRHTWTRTILARALVFAGRTAEALEENDEALAEDPRHAETLALEMASQTLWAAGRFQRSLEATRRSLAWNVDGLSLRRVYTWSYGGLSAWELGDEDTARQFARMAAEGYAGKRFFGWEREALWAATVTGAGPGGIRELEDATERHAANGLWPTTGWMALDLLELAAAAGERAVADRALAWAEAGLLLADAAAWRGLAALARAHHELAFGAAAEAARHAAAAHAGFADAGWDGYTARALVLEGRAFADAGERDPALGALKRAVAACSACGAARRRSEAIVILEQLGSAGKRAAAAAQGAAALTDREREVALLAAAGLTAKEIGERLFISTRTVETHLARSYAKLGVTSKVELVRRRAELGI
jgi:DNA-binding CsgD family transcriptional regulator